MPAVGWWPTVWLKLGADRYEAATVIRTVTAKVAARKVFHDFIESLIGHDK